MSIPAAYIKLIDQAIADYQKRGGGRRAEYRLQLPGELVITSDNDPLLNEERSCLRLTISPRVRKRQEIINDLLKRFEAQGHQSGFSWKRGLRVVPKLN